MNQLLIDCLSNPSTIGQYLSQTRKAQSELLSKKSSQCYHVQSAKYGLRQPVQIKNPLLIKSLFSCKKLTSRDTSLPICTMQSLPAQSLIQFQTDRIHSRCPAVKKLRLKSGFRGVKSMQDEQVRVNTAPAICRSPPTGRQQFFKTITKQEQKPKRKGETKREHSEWGSGGWNIVDDNFDTKLFMD